MEKLIVLFYSDEDNTCEESYTSTLNGPNYEDLWDGVDGGLSDDILEIEFEYGTMDSFGEWDGGGMYIATLQSSEVSKENRATVLKLIGEALSKRGIEHTEWEAFEYKELTE